MRHAPTVSRLRFAPRAPLHRRFRLCVISFQSQHARHNRAAGFSYHTSMLPFPHPHDSIRRCGSHCILGIRSHVKGFTSHQAECIAVHLHGVSAVLTVQTLVPIHLVARKPHILPGFLLRVLNNCITANTMHAP